jgi:hypothetical protein
VIVQCKTDFRHAWRALFQTPGFLFTSIGTLALAIGAVAGMFSVVNTVILKPLPYPESDRLVVVDGTAPGSDLPERFGPGMEFYLHYKERSKLLDGIFVFGAGTSTLRTEDRVERINGLAVQRHAPRLACRRNSGVCQQERRPRSAD